MNGWAARPGEPTLAEAGERAALREIIERLPPSAVRLLGPGDDAAVLAVPDGRVVVTADSMIEGPDFRREWTRPYDLGWKLAATNLADIAAMGARPTALLVALAIPDALAVRALAEVAEGLRDACAALAPGCGIEGGDLGTSTAITAVATAFGDLDGRAPVLRSGARPGDVVALSGRIGVAARGLELLAAGEDGPEIAAQLRPSPPVADGVLAALAGATAMIDVSDGLALDASRLATASGVGIDLDGGLTHRELAGGEDHALLAAFRPGGDLPGGFRALGLVFDGAGICVGGERYEDPDGWDPFRR